MLKSMHFIMRKFLLQDQLHYNSEEAYFHNSQLRVNICTVLVIII
jgi:hypothetical protein